MLGKWNAMGLSILRNMNQHWSVANRSMERLSSGYRINRAADDPAGLAISEKMRAQIRGLGQAARNIQDGISLLQTAEGALNETHAILQRMRELGVQAATDTLTDEDRSLLNIEFEELKKRLLESPRILISIRKPCLMALTPPLTFRQGQMQDSLLSSSLEICQEEALA